MTPSKLAKLKRFSSDDAMHMAVKEQLTKQFMKKRETDVHVLASQTLALQMLEEAWSIILSYKNVEDTEAQTPQIGL